MTLEHLLLSLADDPEAIEVMSACGVDLPALKKRLTDYLDTELDSLRRAEPQAELTANARRVLDRAAVPGGPERPPGYMCITSINVMLAILSEAESYASFFLREQGYDS